MDYIDRQFITAAILTAPQINGGMGAEAVAMTFKSTLIALAKSGAYEALSAAAQEAREASGQGG